MRLYAWKCSCGATTDTTSTEAPVCECGETMKRDWRAGATPLYHPTRTEQPRRKSR